MRNRAVGLRYMAQAGITLLLLAGVLSLVYMWQQQSAAAQARALADARTRWQARPFTAYELHIERGPPPHVMLTATYTVTDETLNRPRLHGIPRRSVASYLDFLDSYSQTIAPNCTFAIWCVRPTTQRAYVEYDEQLGYPRTMMLERTEHPDWFNMRFWVHLVRSGLWRDCENLRCTRTYRERFTIVSLTPLQAERPPPK